MLMGVLYTPTVSPMESDRISADPAISNGPSGQSIGHDWILLLVQAKSGESQLKPFRSNTWLDWL